MLPIEPSPVTGFFNAWSRWNYPMAYRVAAVSFLNTIPLIDWFEKTGDERIALSRALPSLLAGMLANGEADVALLPVVEIFRGASGGMLPGTGIACRGDVDTVKMFYRGDPSGLMSVAVDRGSRTSVALLRILLAELFGIQPEFTEIEPRPDWRPDEGQGALIIGDRCFEYEKTLREKGETDVDGYDLGGAWHQLTGLPFVFAAWAVAPGFPEKAGANALGTRFFRVPGKSGCQGRWRTFRPVDPSPRPRSGPSGRNRHARSGRRPAGAPR